MYGSKSTKSAAWGEGESASRCEPIALNLLRVVDAGLCGVIFVAPYFFGGRHDLGRLVLVVLTTLTATAWFTRQAVLQAPRGPKTAAHLVLLLAAGLVVLQILPLPPAWLSLVSPRTIELLPLWNATENQSPILGTWQTVSLNPHEATKSLAMLICYGMLFVVVTGRIQQRSDLERLLRWIAVAATLMATFGLIQYFTSDGRFFWFYTHPTRSAAERLSGSFANPNHFAHFLALGLGPLAGWLVLALKKRNEETPHRIDWSVNIATFATLLLVASLTSVVFAALLSLSRGGALAIATSLATLAAIYAHGRLINAKYIWAGLGLAIVVLGLLSLYGYEQVSRRLNTLTDGSLDTIDRNEGRRKIWHANLSAIHAGGLLGAGAGSHSAIYPVYLEASLPYEYTHAESGYLQVATENGFVGVSLLLAVIGLLGIWSAVCVRHARSDSDRLCFAAAAAGLAASASHSVVDFVWYIPACMSITIILAACVLRLSQLSSAQGSFAPALVVPKGRWFELATASALLGGWAIHTCAGPGIASVYWDRYLRLSVSKMALKRSHWSDVVANREQSPVESRESLNEAMLRQLERVIAWDPKFARAHLRLTAHLIIQFDQRQLKGPNRVNLMQVRDAVLSSGFTSNAKLHGWLRSAFGNDALLLLRAQAAAHESVILCPLQGEGYGYLAQLCFLDCQRAARVDAYMQQALRVRPHDSDVLFEAGRQEVLRGNDTAAVEYWQQCFDDAGPHQLKIIYLLAGRISASAFLSALQPDWRTLSDIWARYRDTASPEEVDVLLNYAAEATKRETAQNHGASKASVWYMQASMYADVGRHDEALDCLQRAYACDSRQYYIRNRLAQALVAASQFAEAEPHFRWCLARRPEDRSLREALVEISKQRIALRELNLTSPRRMNRGGVSRSHQNVGASHITE